MLEIRKGKSMKSYENVFFRKIAEELTRLFQQRNWHGILLGMPSCKAREDLQLDCLLITAQQMIIIDFKKYSGTLQLPIEADFASGKWLLSDGQIVKGGSAPNPYTQMRKQRRKLIELMGRRLAHFDNKSVSTIVCFHEKMDINGAVPLKYQIDFSIADATNYANQIADIIDVVEEKNRNYLSEQARKLFVDTVFTTAPYTMDSVVEVAIEEPVVELPAANENMIQQIRSFLNSDRRVMIVTGNTKSGKTSLIPTIREQAFHCAFTDVPVFAYSNRIRRKMLEHNPYIEEVESLFGTIFDFASETIDESYKKHIPLRKPTLDIEDEKTLYIIDDSQLMTNTSFDEELVFGSGKLLEDLLAYMDLSAHPERKLILMGDKNKLSYGSKDENALNKVYIQTLLQAQKVNADICTMELLANMASTEIVHTCNQIAKSIAADRYNQLLIQPTEEIMLCHKEQKRALLDYAVTHSETSKFLVFSNEQAGQINRWIKRNILRNGEELNVRDGVIFNSTIQAYAPNASSEEAALTFAEPKRIDNGVFGEIVYINPANRIEKRVDVKEQEVLLTFIPCHIRLQDGTIVETYVFDNYLKALKNELNKEELIAYQIILSFYEKELFARWPFEQSPEFERMVASGDYVRIEDKDKVTYRKASDKRKLTDYEKGYRQRLLRKLQQPDSEYFRLYNAARVKFSWAMTVNKAMAYSFEHVFFNVMQDEGRGITNREYFKWLYTGISTATHQVQLINWQPITPFLKTDFQKLPSGNVPKSVKYLFTFNERSTSAEQLRVFLEQQLATVAEVIEIKSRNYLEIVQLVVEGRPLELFFDYTGANEVKIPRLKKGDIADFDLIVARLSVQDKEIPEAVGEMKDCLEELRTALKVYGILMNVSKFSDWHMLLHFAKEQQEVEVQLRYNKKCFITQFNYLTGDEALFDEIVQLIPNFYGLEHKQDEGD